jgi:hypothetical protein
VEGYNFTADDFAALLVRTFYPEKTDRETPIIRDYLLHHLSEFDRVSFSVRVGEGVTVPEGTLEGVARSAARSSRKRIDILGWKGHQPTIVEVKERIVADALGQLLMYRQLLLQEEPNADDPRLVAIGRYSDPATLSALAAQGVDVFLYPGEAPQ